MRSQLRRQEQRGVGGAPGGPVDQDLVNGFGDWTSGDEVHYAGHRSGAVEGGGDALDYLNLIEIHGRNLQESEASALLAEQGQTVCQKACVAPAHSLDANARGAQRGGGGLDP